MRTNAESRRIGHAIHVPSSSSRRSLSAPCPLLPAAAALAFAPALVQTLNFFQNTPGKTWSSSSKTSLSGDPLLLAAAATALP
ncbi:hypothetical protein F503_03408 [Ophiostoma piceae UAMH 11346]|uniref:Uncharacterized protein n=1 Tax=Ophiostoma piceae (strain UAMH 11346) TaxID=1262450 RepID=S3C555_OPHP1|nr:hypothetical protein F503_03408 [Ophiostoma piceae UAMH 11346]